MILIGSIQPTTGDASSAGIPQEGAVELALEEFNESGLLGDIRFGFIGCDSTGETELGVAAATHLADVIGVPAIVGPAFSGIYIETITTVTVPLEVMTISGSATSETITTIPDDGLAWRTVASDVFQSVAIADRVRDLQSAAEDAGDMEFRVAAFGKDDAYGKGLLFAVGAQLEEELGEDNYFGTIYADPSNDPNADLAGALAGALDSNFSDADVVLLFGTSEVVELLGIYESILDDDGGGLQPRYILSDGGRIDETLAFAVDNPTIHDRLEGTIPSLENGAIYTGFKQRYAGKFGNDPTAFGSNAYDAAYLFAYAAATLRRTEEDITGPALAAMMGSMISGQPIEAGPADLGSALTALEAGATIDFDGASGPLTFDLSTGEAPSNINRYVLDVRAPDDVRFTVDGQYLVAGAGNGEWTGIGEE